MSMALKAFQTFNTITSFLFPSATAHRAVRLFTTPRRFPAKEWELIGESSGQRIQITEELRAIRWFPPAPNGRKALLVHGWEGRASQMSAFAPALLEQGYEVLALDFPAHGLSAGQRTHIAELADCLLTVQKHEGHFDTIIAHSMGGPSTAIAISKGLTADRLALISSPSRMDRALTRFGKFIGLSDKAVKLFVQYMGDHVGIPAKEADTTIGLRNFAKPVLLIHDENDREVPLSETRYVADAIDHAKFIKTTGLGHKRILKTSEVIEKVTTFVIASDKADTPRQNVA